MTCHHGGGSPCDRRDCQTLFGLLRIRSPRRDVWPYVHVDVDVGVDVDVDVGVRVCGHGQTCLYLPCGIMWKAAGSSIWIGSWKLMGG